ncbi:BSD-domain protein, putative [Plasmodium berghei]|uniref:BSD-domain protein, putative n=2 Tax=Plasmodium berghei TaxID=5821 RepID=A0A509AJD6_PLABA|nr:BSD-domain protein, putative [Plasmodium berghei ANKA]CXI32225.1 BSD-domain protein, putative [Plasmodium berghei]SCM21108.1 BSD-domain protein, putative [Plasmodium berghei]SCN24464.1 BSD-domain protein, putative [Plasmodium berghei]SCO59651.1 BSD-domain protein, putative [Plasmodium berghei]SCO60827.1 BSD-domain protein, putative [Plasmodium berghei]|eukprot:XP_034421131.1 BSD-domain protein, putative [Plasmodium berghei ANKA]
MYSLWKELSNQVKKKAENINTILNEININNVNIDLNEGNNNTNSMSLKTSINNKINEINNKYILNATETPEFIYYNNKIVNGINNFKKIVSDIYHEKINATDDGNENINSHNSNSILNDCKIYLSRVVPWKKGDIMVSKIYRKKYGESCPIKLPNNNINRIIYEQVLKLNKDKNKIINTNILQNYNFNWGKKKIQSEEILKQDINLLETKNSIVPTYMNELAFWKSYYFNIDIIYNELADYIYQNKQTIYDEYIREEQCAYTQTEARKKSFEKSVEKNGEKKNNSDVSYSEVPCSDVRCDKIENQYNNYPNKNNLLTFSYSTSSSYIRGFDEAYDESKRFPEKCDSTELIDAKLIEMKNSKCVILNSKHDKMETTELSKCQEKQIKQNDNINNENNTCFNDKVNKIMINNDNEEILFHFDQPNKNQNHSDSSQNDLITENETVQTLNIQKNSNNIIEKYKEINIDDINFVDDINFADDINKFDVKELEQFEKDILNF